MSAAVEPATVLPSAEAAAVVSESTAQLPGAEGLSRALPGLGDNAIVRVDRAHPRRDPASGDALTLTVEGETWWTLPFAAGERIVRLGTLPDLDGDRVAEVRAAYLSPHDVGVLTRIVSGRTGVALLDLGPEHRATVWPDADSGAFPSNWPASIALSSLVRGFGGDFHEVRRLLAALRDTAAESVGRREQSESVISGRAERPEASWFGGDTSSPLLGPMPATVKLRRVVFSNSHQVIRDRAPKIPYPSEWFDSNLDGDADDWVRTVTNPFAGDIRAPLCYTINQPITVNSVEFHVSPAYGLGQSLADKVVRGRLPGSGLDAFVSTTLTYNGDGTVITATNFTTNAGDTMTTIGRIADYSIDWGIDVTGTLVSYTAGTSRNHVHWVLQSPTGSFALFYSLIDIGCRRAHGRDGSSEVAIANDIYGEFAGRHVLRATDVLENMPVIEPMTYWLNWQTARGAMPQLLEFGDGRCGAWVQFFNRSLHAVGIDPVNEHCQVTLPEHVTGAQRMLLKEVWSASGQSNANGPFGAEYRYINIPLILWPHPDYFIGPSQYFWRMNDRLDMTGVSAQGASINPNPASMFANHALAHVQGVFYDPSYGGSTLHSAAEIDDSFQAFGLLFGIDLGMPLVVDEGAVGIDLDGDNIVTPGNWVGTAALIIQDNPPNVQTQLTFLNPGR